MLDLDRVIALAGGVQLSLEAFSGASGTGWADVSFEVGGLVLARTGDAAVTPSVSWRVTDRLTLSSGAEWVLAPSSAVTVGALLDSRDAWWLRLRRSF